MQETFLHRDSPRRIATHRLVSLLPWAAAESRGPQDPKPQNSSAGQASAETSPGPWPQGCFTENKRGKALQPRVHLREDNPALLEKLLLSASRSMVLERSCLVNLAFGAAQVLLHGGHHVLGLLHKILGLALLG